MVQAGTIIGVPDVHTRAFASRILGALCELGSQVFVTAIDDAGIDAADWRDARRFHVEQGDIQAAQ